MGTFGHSGYSEVLRVPKSVQSSEQFDGFMRKLDVVHKDVGGCTQGRWRLVIHKEVGGCTQGSWRLHTRKLEVVMNHE